MENTVAFELEESQHIDFEDYENNEFGIARLKFLGSNPNSHKLKISDDVLKECASTALGKWVVAKMNVTGTDMMGHDPKEQIMGMIPKDQEIQFSTDEDGYLRASADVVISKIYAKDFCDVLSSDGNHSVSVEMTVSTENGNKINDTVNAFNIIGVTVLGTTVNPSCEGSDIEFVRFAEEAENFFNGKEEKDNDNQTKRKEGEREMNEIEFSAVDIGNLWSSLWNALGDKDYSIQNIYEDGGQKFALIQKYGEDALYKLNFNLTEDGITLADDIVKVSIDVVESDDIRKFAEPENVAEYRTFAKKEAKEEEKEEEQDNKEEEKKEEEKDTKMSEEETEKKEEPKEEEKDTKMSEVELSEEVTKLQALIQEKDTLLEQYSVELEELRNYKQVHMEAERASKVDAVMEKYSKFMDEKTASAYKEEGLQCNFEAVDGWANKVAASVTDVIAEKLNNKKDEGFTRMSSVLHIDRQEDGGSTPLERLRNKYL